MKALSWIVSVVGAIAAAVAVLWSETVQRWVDGHPRTLYLVALGLFIACVILAEAWWSARGRASGSEREDSTSPGVVDLQPPTASERDRVLFARFLKEFPADRGSINFLETRFFGKQWRWTELDHVARFAHSWERGVFFDDPEVDRARVALLDACQTFMSDAAGESDVSDHDIDLARLNESRFRVGGQAEWESARKTLREEASAIVQAHDNLHRIGRQRGL